MPILSIRTVGDPVLRTVCDPVTVFDKDLKTLIHSMLDTMYEVNGVGLAAPQIGNTKRLFTYGNIDGQEGHIINPVLERGEEPQEGSEGCLSVPGLSSPTPRTNWARVTGVDYNNHPIVLEGEGLFARMLQHETDHLDGHLYIDRLVGEERKTVMRAIRSSNFDHVTERTQRERATRVSSGFGTNTQSSSSAFGSSFLKK
ncbi:peptide deformylase [Rothia sp. CCM 9419]|uniref:peptide deformylase n=1 Tax=Rothia sp. CCM 9419 TaxID=3402662 RepID=UPI003ADD8DF3